MDIAELRRTGVSELAENLTMSEFSDTLIWLSANPPARVISYYTALGQGVGLPDFYENLKTKKAIEDQEVMESMMNLNALKNAVNPKFERR